MALHLSSRRLRCLAVGRWLTTGGPSFEASEVEKFVEIDWWNKRGECSALHRLNPIRTLCLRNMAVAHFGRGDPRLPLEKKTAIDVGCGGGIFSESLARLGAKVTAIDVLRRNVDIAKEHAQHDPIIRDNIEYRCISAEEVVRKGEQFDLVVASEVIEHVRNPLEFLNTLSKLMHDDGLLYLTTLNRTLPSLIGAVWMAESVLGLLPKGTHDWGRFLTPEEMTTVANRYGLKLNSISGLNLELLTGKWKTSEDVSINYATAFVKRSLSESKSGPDITVSSTSL